SIKELKRGAVTNNYGFYSLSVPKGDYTVEVSYMGYQTFSTKIDLNEPLKLDVELKTAMTEIKEVVVTSQRRDANVTMNRMSAQQVSIATIRKMPALMGEVDLLKAVQLLPGVVSAGEGTSSFSVRGGGIDQNLIVLDEATIYNASHMMGFFSVFNNDAIKNMTLYKGDIPASYDGRLSSLLDIQMRDGNSKKFSGSGGIGLISSRLTLEGPIGSDKTSFIVSARRTYADLFLKLSSDKDINKNQLYFYDFNAKINHRIDDNNRIFLSGYYGQDKFKNSDAGFNFGNATVTARWNHLFSPKLFSNYSFNYSRYNYGLQSSMSDESNFDWKYNMQDVSLRADFSYFVTPENTFKFGYNAILHNLKPGTVKSKGGKTSYDNYILPDINAFEHALYISDEYQVSKRLSMKAGLRLTAFSSIGSGTVYNYDNNYNAIDSTVYKSGHIIKTFYRLSPRVGITYLLDNKSSVKASYARTNQFLQMASNSTAGTPLDLWFTAGKNIKPQTCDQYAAGYFRNFLNNELEASAEFFYKDMQNTIDFRDHATLILNKKLDGELRFGQSKAYGAEFQIQKNLGKLTGWVSYTYSHTERTIQGVNNNEMYLAPYDRPSTLYIVGNYELNEYISFGANFIYATGQPVTYPVARMEVGNVILPVYSKRNEYRMPDYHRLDVSLTWKPKQKKKRNWSGEWNFSIYNIYGHKNAWAINFVDDQDTAYKTKAEMTYLFTFVPSVTYNFKF
ncbi:MAG TPA: TonB-dependent receptor, partial [Paludibacter sp.]|nr:TonB-dependent receptor [Paludibacter sp.]